MNICLIETNRINENWREWWGILQTHPQIEERTFSIIISPLSWGVSVTALQCHVAFIPDGEMVRDRQTMGGDLKKKTRVSLSAILLSESPGLWSAHFRPTLWPVSWFVCNRRCRESGAPENVKRSSYTQTTSLLPAGQRSAQPPALLQGWYCDVNLKYTTWQLFNHIPYDHLGSRLTMRNYVYTWISIVWIIPI